MNLPDIYNIKSVQQKSAIIKSIADVLMRIDDKEYPNVCSMLYNDNKKVELIDTIIINMYSDMGGGDIYEILSSIEVTMNE